MQTVAELLQQQTKPTQVERLDKELLLAHCLGKSRGWLFAYPEAEVGADTTQQYIALLQRRQAGEPVAYILGEQEFWSLPLRVTADTLVPRADTEVLVEWALELPMPEQAAVLDLGTGSGAIALALSKERPSWQVTALDRSESALSVAQANAMALGLKVACVVSHWFEAIGSQRFSLLISNPPYVAAEDPHLQGDGVQFEPLQALVSGEDGLDDIRIIVERAPTYLEPGGVLLLEHGWNQGRAVRSLLESAGFGAVQTRQDLGGQDRVSGGRWPG